MPYHQTNSNKEINLFKELFNKSFNDKNETEHNLYQKIYRIMNFSNKPLTNKHLSDKVFMKYFNKAVIFMNENKIPVRNGSLVKSGIINNQKYFKPRSFNKTVKPYAFIRKNVFNSDVTLKGEDQNIYMHLYFLFFYLPTNTKYLSDKLLKNKKFMVHFNRLLKLINDGKIDHYREDNINTLVLRSKLYYNPSLSKVLFRKNYKNLDSTEMMHYVKVTEELLNG